ncbi:MAG: hypothetical protein K0S76_268 [Herbinix sp.]|nr:hypothetical protein [Herbinix sp.]
MDENKNNQNINGNYNQNPYDQNSSYQNQNFNTNANNTNMNQAYYRNPNNNPYYYNNQQQYYHPYPNSRHFDPNSVPMTVKDWLITMLLMMIPIANIVLIFVWAFGNNVNKSKKAYFQASLILAGIVIALYLVLILIVIGVFAFTYNPHYI